MAASKRSRPLLEMFERVTGRKVLATMNAAVDESYGTTILAAMEPKADLLLVRIQGKQADGSWKTFGPYEDPADVPYVVPGVGNLRFTADIFSFIGVRNVGGDGIVFCKITDDTGKVIYYGEKSVAAGGDVAFPEYGGPVLVFDMPTRNYGLIIEVGH